MKDSLGNELAVGQRVQLVLPTPHVLGYVHSITTGAIVTGGRSGGGAARSPAILTITATFSIPMDPMDQTASSVTRVYTPEEAAEAPRRGLEVIPN